MNEIQCPHLRNGNCNIAKAKAGFDVPTHESTCKACLSGIYVFDGIIILEKIRRGDIEAIPLGGPGTELKKLISWFPVPKKTSCKKCSDLEFRMNKWGADVCEQKIDFICNKLRVAALRRNLPYSRSLAEVLVRKAIRNSRRFA
jgi:hypothetical protein